MANIVDQLKKFFSRITTVNNPNEIPGSSIADVIAYATKNLNVNANGNLISKLPEVIVPEGPEFVLTAFQNGDKIKKGTRFIFPKSQMANLEAFFRDRVANWSYGNDFNMLCVKEGGMFILIEEDGMGFFMLNTGMPEDVFWASADYPDMGVTAGWQYKNLVDEGEYYVYTYPYGDDEESSEIDIETDFAGKAYLDQWNGIMIGIDNSQVSEAPATPALTAFAVGDTIEKGTTYAFDKSKGSDIEAMLNGLTYEIDPDAPEPGMGKIDLLGTFALDNSDREPTLVAISINGANGLFVIDSDTYVPIYATGEINYYDVIKATQGWNIDGDSYTLLQTARPSSIQSILETTPAWNGVLVGKGE